MYDVQESGIGSKPSCSITKDEALTTLQFYGKSYDDLRSEADKNLQQLWSHLKALTSRVDEVGNVIDEIQRCSYLYNVKIVGLPEIDSQESASATTSLCISLLKASGVDINKQDVDIAHRVPTRQATAGPRPVICKFTRRIVKEEVINLRKEACKVSATSIGLPAECSLRCQDFRSPHSTDPETTRRCQEISSSVGQKTLLSICASLRTLVPSGSKARKTLNDLLAKRTCL